MNVYADKKIENKTHSVASERGGKSSFRLSDNRQSAAALRKPQEAANNGRQAKQAAQLQSDAHGHNTQNPQGHVIQCNFQDGASYQYNGEGKNFLIQPTEGKARNKKINKGVIFDASLMADGDASLSPQGGAGCDYVIHLKISDDAQFSKIFKEGDWHKHVRAILDSDRENEGKDAALEEMLSDAADFGNVGRLRDIVKDERMLHRIKGSGSRSEMYMHISERAAEKGMPPDQFAKAKYGDERGDLLLSKLSELGERFLPLVHDMGLMHEDDRVQAFVDFVKGLKKSKSESADIWTLLEDFRKSREKVSLYRAMNLTDEERDHILTHGMDPGMLRYKGGAQPVHSLLAPEIGNVSTKTDLELARRHIRSGTRPMARSKAIGITGLDAGVFQNEISGGEDILHSFSKERAVSDYVAATPEMSGKPKPGQHMRMMLVNVADIDVIKPERLPGGGPEFDPSKDEVIGKMGERGYQLPENTPYSDIESLIPGRIFPGEVQQEGHFPVTNLETIDLGNVITNQTNSIVHAVEIGALPKLKVLRIKAESMTPDLRGRLMSCGVEVQLT